jgi:hypothetical protein
MQSLIHPSDIFHPMFKNITTNQILLIAIATVLFLLAAFSFYLLQDPSAPLPFAPPSPSSTVTSMPLSQTYTFTPSSTGTPTRQTSYTPFASPATTGIGTPLEVTGTLETASPIPSGTTSPLLPTNTSTIQPPASSAYPLLPTNTSTIQPPITATSPFTPVPATASVSPTTSPTLITGEYEVTGRVVQNGTPVANVAVEFEDDDPPRKRTTNSGGHYSFITLAPGTTFTLAFKQIDNPQLIPAPEVASFARIEGTLPTGIDIIDLPDLEVSINIEEMIFELLTPTNGATFSAAAINSTNPIQFVWTLYNEGDFYQVMLGANGSDNSIWVSDETTLTNWWWNGTLDNGSHITQGAYWWCVAVKKSLGDYDFTACTQKSYIVFSP